MKKKNVNKLLFMLASIQSLPAIASVAVNGRDFYLPEELPIEMRTRVYERAAQLLNLNPELTDENGLVAVDREGNVYVLDRRLVQMASNGEPSCRGGGK